MFSLLRSLGGLMAVLAVLSAALWFVRRYDIALPGRTGGGKQARLAIAERIAVDAKRSLLLVRRDGAEHMLLISPEGHMVIGDGTQTGEPTSFHVELERCRALEKSMSPCPAPVPVPAIPMPIPAPAKPLRRRPRSPRHDPIPQ